MHTNAFFKAEVKLDKLEYPGLFYSMSQIFLFDHFQSQPWRVLNKCMCWVIQNMTKSTRDTFQGTKHVMKVWKYQHIWKYSEREQFYTIQTLLWRLVNTALTNQDVGLHLNLHIKFSKYLYLFPKYWRVKANIFRNKNVEQSMLSWIFASRNNEMFYIKKLVFMCFRRLISKRWGCILRPV